MTNQTQEFIKKLAAELCPDEMISDERRKDLLARGGSVELGIDGNAAYARLGPDLQDGEACFRLISDHEMGDGNRAAEARATVRALRILTARCHPNGDGALPYRTDRHPTMGGN
jgi:hypothetical protein